MDNVSVSIVRADRSDEPELVAAARSDPSAFEELYRCHEERIYRYLRARTDSHESADDLTQQVFERALSALPRYRERGTPFIAWLFTIARNVAADHRRGARTTVSWDLMPEALHPASGQDPEAAVLEREELLRLRELLVALDPEKRELIVLRFGAGLSLREIGAIVGKSDQAVHKQLTRTLQHLKERYHEEG
jgi:RNA polymerase sigma-70 factor (ECF subfamily)